MAPFLVIAFLLALGVGIVVWHVTDADFIAALRRRRSPETSPNAVADEPARPAPKPPYF